MMAVTNATEDADRTTGGPQAGTAVDRPASRFADRTSDAIRGAFFDELSAVGFGRLSVDAIVKRAGVSKAAVYRRWGNKTEMAYALISEAATSTLVLPDTGSLTEDLHAFLITTHDAMRHPSAARIIPSLLSEATRDESLADVLRQTVETPRRTDALTVLQRAIDRGELPTDCDLDLCLDHMIGALYFHALVRQRDLDRSAIRRLAQSLAAAMAASVQPPPVHQPAEP